MTHGCSKEYGKVKLTRLADVRYRIPVLRCIDIFHNIRCHRIFNIIKPTYVI